MNYEELYLFRILNVDADYQIQKNTWDEHL